MANGYLSTTIDLLRHGEPEGGSKLRGTLDDPLSDLGWQQMQDSVGEGDKWHRIVSSPLLRCHRFSQELKERLSLELTVHEGFREIGFGIWEGLTTKELMQKDPTALQRYWQDPFNHAPDQAEPMDEFLKRVHGSWHELIERHEGSHTLLVCHGGVIRAILTEVLGMAPEKMWNFDVPYANFSRVVYHTFQDGSRVGQLVFHQRKLNI